LTSLCADAVECSGSGKTVVFELAVLRYFGPDLLAGGELKKKAQNAIDRRQQESFQRDHQAQAQAGAMNEDEANEIGPKEELDPDDAPAAVPTKRPRWGAQWKKALYMAPIKALCDERDRDWAKFTLRLGLNVIQITGDREASYSQLAAAHIIITTPEKW
jgi:ATP-dependent helicase YprA (DUF1998 family)